MEGQSTGVVDCLCTCRGVTQEIKREVVSFILEINIMTVKRRNHGRNKKGRGHVKRVRCASTGKAVPKDKAIKRMVVRSIVDQSSARDIKEARVFENYQLPKLYIKQYYSVEAAVHQRLVRSRSKEDRRFAGRVCEQQELDAYCRALRNSDSTFPCKAAVFSSHPAGSRRKMCERQETSGLSWLVTHSLVSEAAAGACPVHPMGAD
ncbi:40s ribosomal protein s26 [Nannochloropsis gaditana]|uniref:40S ribosomal protein S26 n=1 Tax=Nannochloropsis gaditana TaxID=72520 RepID=W7TNL3_9STRA|nr:40s ribosomal protein s26 [Nannochloropsis gaditana]